jgi:hypothetical protein
MIRSLLLSIVASGLVACGGPVDETWDGAEGEGNVFALPIGGVHEEPSPAQRLLLLLTGTARSGLAGTKSSPALFGSGAGERSSSPDPMPGRQREDDTALGGKSASDGKHHN